MNNSTKDYSSKISYRKKADDKLADNPSNTFLENNEIKALPLKMNRSVLDNLILFAFTEHPTINNTALADLRTLLEAIDLDFYENKPNLLARIEFLKKALESMIDEGIFDLDLISENLTDSYYADIIVEEIIPFLEDENNVITDATIQFLRKYISERLRFAYLFSLKDEFREALEELDSGEYETLKEINDKIIGSAEKLCYYSRKFKNKEEDSMDFDLSDYSYNTIGRELFDSLKEPSSILETGIQYLNNMTNGGLESGRTYLLLGPTKGFKSGLLLSTAYWVQQYNKNRIRLKNKNRRPAVLYITQENTMKETLARLYGISVDGTDIRNLPTEEIIENMKRRGNLNLEDPNSIDLVLKYRRPKSITTNDIFSIIEEIEESGREVICLVHDYVKKILPTFKTKETRIDLGNIVMEFSDIAKTKDIPVVIAYQLNREAIKTIETMIASGKTDIARQLGSSNVGESWGMVEEADMTIIINREYSESQKQTFLSFKLCHSRVKEPEIKYFAHPFEKENTMRLIPDINLEEPLSRVSIAFDEIQDTADSMSKIKRNKRHNRRNHEEEDDNVISSLDDL